MKTAEYLRPSSLAELRSISGRERAVFMAGGTDVIVKSRARECYETKTVIDVSGIPELQGIRLEENGDLWIGSAVTVREILANQEVRERFPLLAGAAARLGSTQIRNRATVGGNLANACIDADLIPPLLVLNAEVLTEEPEGPRRIPVREFFRSTPACLRHDEPVSRTCFFPEPVCKKTVLAPGGILTGISLPAYRPCPGEKDVRERFDKFLRSRHIGRAEMNMACRGHFSESGEVLSFEAAFGGIFPKPEYFEDEEGILTGKRPAEADFRRCARSIAEKASAFEKYMSDGPERIRTAEEWIYETVSEVMA